MEALPRQDVPGGILEKDGEAQTLPSQCKGTFVCPRCGASGTFVSGGRGSGLAMVDGGQTTTVGPYPMPDLDEFDTEARGILAAA